ncbi:MAG TPA: class I SAM-dependent methyltransferase [Bryobacteraceae bacterium]|nr:class I SAM-dependent methyltransferase [Bryobacteraceae bacterium]
MLKNWIRRRLEAAGYVVFNTRSPAYYARDSLFTTNNDHFRASPDFQAAYARGVKAGGGADPHIEWRVHVALWAAGAAVRVPGDFVECGVNAGFFSSAVLHHLDWNRLDKRFFLIDTFAGPVAAQYSGEEVRGGRFAAAQDAAARGAYVTDLARVRANFAEWFRVEVVQGVVPEVLPSVPVSQVAFLHIDMNCAYPERAALEYFWGLLAPGALVLFDDYAYFGYESLTRAIDEAARSLGAQVLSLPTGQGLIVR